MSLTTIPEVEIGELILLARVRALIRLHLGEGRSLRTQQIVKADAGALRYSEIRPEFLSAVAKALQADLDPPN